MKKKEWCGHSVFIQEICFFAHFVFLMSDLLQERALSGISCNTVPSSVESTPGRWMSSRDGHLVGIASLPGTPLSSASHFSNRSSNDSYSSSSSTRQLLASNGGDALPPSQDKAVQL